MQNWRKLQHLFPLLELPLLSPKLRVYPAKWVCFMEKMEFASSTSPLDHHVHKVFLGLDIPPVFQSC